MLNIKPRQYQQKIFETAKDSNTLVVLPTGLGKTLIALMLSIDSIQKYPLKKILMLAPTRAVVEQHLKTFSSSLPELFADLQLFTGSIHAEKRKEIFQTADIIFSTPQCIANDLKNNLYTLEDISLLVMDECHRCLKNYDYTAVASSYKKQAEKPHILGLTASPGADSKKLKEICAHLNIEKIEVRTRNSEDVKPYLQELKFEKVEVPFPKEFMEVKFMLKQLYDKKVEQLKSRNLLFGPVNKISLLQLQNRLAMRVPMRDFNAMAGMSLTAQAVKISHAIELLETQTLSGVKAYMENLETQAKNKKSRAVQSLVKTPEFIASINSIKDLIKNKIEHPKIEELYVLLEKEFKENKNAKVIVFTQFRETAAAIVNKISSLQEIRAKVFIGQAKKADTGLSQKEQKQVIEDFREGKTNVIVATSIAEEGLDIPEVSAVIFYESIPSAIRKIQRAGRTARLSPGKILILLTKDTRDIAFHYASSAKEKKMYSAIETMKKELENKPKTLEDFK